MPKWGIFNASLLLNEHGHPPFFISKLKLSYDKYSVDKIWTKIYCHFYFRGITLRMRCLTINYVFSRNIYYKRWRSEIELSVSKKSLKKCFSWKFIVSYKFILQVFNLFIASWTSRANRYLLFGQIKENMQSPRVKFWASLL